MRLLRFRDNRRMPWKNGGGETIEIATTPDGATFETFNWRVSMARVEQSGPFSQFPGIDRSLSIIAGAGITLDLPETGAVMLDRSAPPFFFPGDDGASCTLLDGPIDDLNVMTRRGRCRQRVTRYRLAAPANFSWQGDVALVIAVGKVDIAAGGTAVSLDAKDAVQFARADSAEFAASPHGSADLFLIEFASD
jgi:environmental stress-induced protein Ves